MTHQLIVRAQLPGNAHLHVPDDTPVIIISRHTTSRRGVKNALQSRARTFTEYRKTHGNAAASRCWIERGENTLDLEVLQNMVEFGEKWRNFEEEYGFAELARTLGKTWSNKESKR